MGSCNESLGNYQIHQPQAKYMRTCLVQTIEVGVHIISGHHSRWCRPCEVSVLLLPWLSGRCPLLLQLWPSQFHSYKWWTHHCETCRHWRQKRKAFTTHKHNSTIHDTYYSATVYSIMPNTTLTERGRMPSCMQRNTHEWMQLLYTI